jgi:catechol 2,3-dioxygenase-like lactoylglutathione lyase family enzyme
MNSIPFIKGVFQMNLSSFYPVLLTKSVSETSNFYVQHFGFEVVFESDWYISLKRETSNTSYELAVIDFTHSTIPDSFKKPVQGLILNFEVDDVDAVYELLIQKGKLPLLLDIRDEAFGQRHFITSDPSGVLIDVIKIIPPTAEFAEQYVELP